MITYTDAQPQTSGEKRITPKPSVRIMPSENRTIDNDSALFEAGRCEYTNALTPTEIDIVVTYLKNLAPGRSALLVAVRNFVRKSPRIAGKLQSLSVIALAALAHESSFRREVPTPDEVAWNDGASE